MLSFKQYLLESVKGNYVSIGVKSPIEIPSLEKIFGGSKICAGNDQHVTLMYSKETDLDNREILASLQKYDELITAKIDGVAAFDAVPKEGERDEKLCTIVVKLKSPTLDKIFKELQDIGLKHSYPDFAPHISLIYDLPIEDKERAMSIVKKELGAAVLLKDIKAAPIKENWADKLK